MSNQRIKVQYMKIHKCALFFSFLFVNEIFIQDNKVKSLWDLTGETFGSFECSVIRERKEEKSAGERKIQLWIKEIKTQWMAEHIEELAEQITAEWTEYFMGHGQNWDEKELGKRLSIYSIWPLKYPTCELWWVTRMLSGAGTWLLCQLIPFFPAISYYTHS